MITWRVLTWMFVLVTALLGVLYWMGVVPVHADQPTQWRIVVIYTAGPKATIYATGTLAECEAFRASLAGDDKTVGPCLPMTPTVRIDHNSGVVEPADIPPAPDAAPAQNEHWTDVPPVPARAPDVERIGQCGTMGDGTELSFVVRLWKAERYAQYLVRADEVVGAVMATLIFPADEDRLASVAYVSLLGRAVERMTGEELTQKWPHPCYMARAVVGTRT